MWNEPRRACGFILSTAPGNRSLENRTVKAGEGKLEPGTVVGTVTAAGADKGKLVAYVAGGADGAQTPTGIITHAVNATDADADVATVERDAEVIDSKLVFGASVDTDAKRAAAVAKLAEAGIIVR